MDYLVRAWRVRKRAVAARVPGEMGTGSLSVKCLERRRAAAVRAAAAGAAMAEKTRPSVPKAAPIRGKVVRSHLKGPKGRLKQSL